MWLWTEKAGDGTSHAFELGESNPFRATLTATVKNVSFAPNDLGIDASRQGIGFIVRKGEWEAKDMDMDRFIPLDKITRNGATASVEVWLVEGDPYIAYAREDADISDRMTDSYFLSDGKTILTSFTVALTTEEFSEFKVYADDAEVEISQITAANGNKTANILLAAGADFTLSYEVYNPKFQKRKEVSLERVFDSSGFTSLFNYSGTLGAIYTPASTEFKLWAPTAKSVKLNLYDAGSGGTATSYDMVKGEKGVFAKTVSGDLNGKYYTYNVDVAGGNVNAEVVDPYAKSAGVNGNRGMVIDTAALNPEGWNSQPRPANTSVTDAVIYEAHIRDLSVDPSSGVSEANRGKFLALTEKNTKNSFDQSTVVSHMKELGVTELHILPMYDYHSIDEASDEPQFNWGYDPQNYNVPEGSYSTDATRGEVRVSELKQMIMALHEEGIRVIMDVVYNHTYKSGDSNFNLIVPGYYYRMVNGKFSNGSGCGNETKSERYMFGKFMKDSTEYWVREYKIDGFRFDLMALHDYNTMNSIYDNLVAIDPNIMIYGEGWTGGTTPLVGSQQASRSNASKMPNIAVFNDIFRDGAKGSVFDERVAGFANGSPTKTDVMHGLVGGLKSMGAAGSWFTISPTQSINYVSAHDNNTLWDKIQLAAPSGTTEAEMVKMNMLCASLVFTAQGTPFFQAGEEILRSKPLEDGKFDHNSYKSPDSVNSIKWDEKNDNIAVFNYYKGMIQLRKHFEGFRISDATKLRDAFEFVPSDSGVIVTKIEYNNQILVTIYNGNEGEKSVSLDNGKYAVYAEGSSAGATEIREVSGNSIKVAGRSATVLLVKEYTAPKKGGCGGQVGIDLAMGALMAVLGMGFMAVKRRVI